MWQYNNTVQKMINSEDFTIENLKEHNPNWTQIPHHP